MPRPLSHPFSCLVIATNWIPPPPQLEFFQGESIKASRVSHRETLEEDTVQMRVWPLPGTDKNSQRLLEESRAEKVVD
jgi:hypothetical protein